MPPQSDRLELTCATPNQRLDKFLAQALPQLSRNQAQQLIKAGNVSAEGLTLKASTPLPAGTTLTIVLPAPENVGLKPQDIPLNIIFEDEQIIVLNKPADLVVHPAAGHSDGTLVNALLHHYPPLAQLDEKRPGIVHRLDRETSGVMAVAKTAMALQNLQQQFKARSVEKLYLALVYGVPPAPQGVIDVPLGRDPNDRQKFAPLKTGKPARTHYKILEHNEEYSLLELKPETGRTHQIRVHLAWLGHPVFGDSVYTRRKNHLGLKRHFLHASQLRFAHPATGQTLSFKAPLPSDLRAVLQETGFSLL